MYISNNHQQNPSFSGIYNNAFIKNGLKFAAENGALFTASTQLLCSATVRPLAIFSSPDTQKENKQVLVAKSLTSSLLSFLIMFGVSLPVANSIKKIDTEPKKYLNPEAIKNLKIPDNLKIKSKNYAFATQLFKLGIGLAIAVPRAMMSASLTPKIFKSVFKQDIMTNNKPKENNKSVNFKQKSGKNIKTCVSDFFDKCHDFLGKKIANVLNKQYVQQFSDKYKDTNLSLHVVSATDLLATSVFAQRMKKSDVKQDKKSILIYNALISTGLTIVSTYLLEFLSKDKTQSICEKIRAANKNDKNAEKYVEGFKIAKPILIMALVYYTLIPLFSAKLSENLYNQRQRCEKENSSSEIQPLNKK